MAMLCRNQEVLSVIVSERLADSKRTFVGTTAREDFIRRGRLVNSTGVKLKTRSMQERHTFGLSHIGY